MGWLPQARASLPGEGGWVPFGSGTQPSALALVPFFASVRHIVDFLSTLPLDAYRAEGDQRIPISAPPLLRGLNAPGAIGQQAWIGQWAYGLAVHGNAVGYAVEMDGWGYPTTVQWIPRLGWEYDDVTGWRIYGTPVPAARIVHTPWIVPPGGTLGLSPVEHFREFWKVGISAQKYADLTALGGLPPATLRNTVLSIPPSDAQVVQERAVKSFATGKPFVTGKDWTLEMNTVPPNQARFMEVLQMTANQTAAIFGIDPREIGGSAADGSITYVNDESKSLDRLNNMRPYIERFDFMTSRLLPERQYLKLNVGATIRTDIKTRTEVIGAQLKDGRLSVNEARALEDRSPVPGGDYYNVPAPGRLPVSKGVGDE